MEKMLTDFVKSCIFLSLVTSSTYQEKIEISPTSASRMLAFNNGSCGTYNTSFEADCNFPDLFSADEGKCKPFNEVDCGNRSEPLTPCDYTNSNCSRPQQNATLCVCEKDLDLNYGMCLSLTDGEYAWPARHWSPYFIQCKSKRTLPSSCTGHSVIYNFFENKCQVVYEVVNAAYSLSLSLNIPESLYHLLSWRPTQFVPLTTQEISTTLLNPTENSDMAKHSTDVDVESVMFTKLSFETAFSTIPKSESYNILERSSLLATPPVAYGILSLHNSASTLVSISSNTGISSTDMASMYQPDSSKQVTISSYTMSIKPRASKGTTEFASSKPETSLFDISSKQQIDIFSPTTSTSISNVLSTRNWFTSRESKQGHFKATQSPSSPVSADQDRASMDDLSPSEFPQILHSSTSNMQLPNSISIQTKPLLNYSKVSNLIPQLTAAKLSSSVVHSVSENKNGTSTDFEGQSPLASSAALSSLEHSNAEVKISTTTDHFSLSPLTTTDTVQSLAYSTNIIMLTTTSLVNSSQITLAATQPSLDLSISEFEIRTTKGHLTSSPKTSVSLEKLSNSTQTIDNSVASLKQTSLPQLTSVLMTTTVNTTYLALTSKPQAALQSFSSLIISSSLSLPSSMFSSSLPESLLSSNPFDSTESITEKVPSALPTSAHATSKVVTALSNFTSSMNLTTSYDSIASIVTASSKTPTQESSMRVFTKLSSSSSNFSKVMPDIKSSEMIYNHVFGQTLSTSQLLKYESYIMSNSSPFYEKGSPTTSKLGSLEYGRSKAIKSQTLFLPKTKSQSESEMPMNPSKINTDNFITKSTSNEALKTSFTFKESFQQVPTSTNVMVLKPTVVYPNKVTVESKIPLLSSRESAITLETSMFPISRSDNTKVTILSDLKNKMKSTLKSTSDSINKLNTAKYSISDDSVLKAPLTLTEDLTTSIKPSKTVTEHLTKSMTIFQSIASSENAEPSVLFPHEQSAIKPPHHTTPTTNKPNDNSAERRKNTRTSIAIGAGVGGGIVFICIILLVVIIVLRKKNKKGKRDFFQVRLPPELFMSRSL